MLYSLMFSNFPWIPTITQHKKTVNRFKQSITLFTSDTVKIFHEFYYRILIFNQANLPLVSNFILKSDYLVFNRQEMIFF